MRAIAVISALVVVAAALLADGASVTGFGPYYASNCAPSNDDALNVFDIETVASYEFTMSAEDFNNLVNATDSAQSYKYTKASLDVTVSGGHETFDEIGIRIRGKGSRGLPKHSFTVKFNKYSDDQKLFNLTKIALRAEPFDPTLSRENLALEFLNAMGVCTQRKSFATVTINEVFMGTFLQTEVVNADWLAARMTSEPLLYKLNIYSTAYQGEQQLFAPAVDFWTAFYNGGKSMIKTGSSSVADYSPLYYLQKIAHEYWAGAISENLFARQLESRFDVDMYLRVHAAEVVLASWDCAIGDGNNWYLYYDTVRDKSVYVPYDEDTVAGVALDFLGGPCPPYNWGCHYSSPLFQGILNVTRYQEQFSAYLAVAADVMDNDPAIAKYVDDVKAIIEPYAIKDFYRSDDVAFPPSVFASSFGNYTCGTGSNADICAPAMMPWLVEWARNVTGDLRPASAGPWVSSVSVANTPLEENPTVATVTAFVDVADGEAPDVSVVYSYDGVTNTSKAMTVTRMANNTYYAEVQVPAVNDACYGVYGLGLYAPLYVVSTTAGAGLYAANADIYPEPPAYLSFYCWTGKFPTQAPTTASPGGPRRPSIAGGAEAKPLPGGHTLEELAHRFN